MGPPSQPIMKKKRFSLRNSFCPLPINTREIRCLYATLPTYHKNTGVPARVIPSSASQSNRATACTSPVHCAVCRELHSGYFQSRDGLPPTPASQHDLSAPPAHLKRRPLGPDHAIIQRVAEVSSRTPCSMSPPSLPLAGSSTRSDQPLQNPQAPGILSHVHTSVRTASVFIYPDLPKPVGYFFFSS